MSTFKYRYSDNLYYSDTDSIYLDTVLPSSLISSTEIGKFKLENIFIKALFLAPKMYSARYFKKDKIAELTKIKGVKTNISFNKLIPLLYKDKHLSLIQEKWFRDIDNSTIKIVTDHKHTLNLNPLYSKRELIYKNKIFVNTKPLKIENSNIIR